MYACTVRKNCLDVLMINFNKVYKSQLQCVFIFIVLFCKLGGGMDM